jgi:hypothetical protein
MSGYNSFLQPMSEFYRSSTHYIVFILRLVTTSLDRFFAVPIRGSWILKLSGTGPVCGPSKKGNGTGTGPDFKALGRTSVYKPVQDSMRILWLDLAFTGVLDLCAVYYSGVWFYPVCGCFVDRSRHNPRCFKQHRDWYGHIYPIPHIFHFMALYHQLSVKNCAG